MFSTHMMLPDFYHKKTDLTHHISWFHGHIVRISIVVVNLQWPGFFQPFLSNIQDTGRDQWHTIHVRR